MYGEQACCVSLCGATVLLMVTDDARPEMLLQLLLLLWTPRLLQRPPVLLLQVLCLLLTDPSLSLLAAAAAAAGVVGAKANNLAKLRNKLPEWIQVPASVALPFGTFEQVLAFGANSGAAARLRELQQELGRAEVRRHLWLRFMCFICWYGGTGDQGVTFAGVMRRVMVQLAQA
jgi:hypothetical protein